jgi:hypothetical protein
MMFKRLCCEGQHVCCCFCYCSDFTQSCDMVQGISRSPYCFGVIGPVSLFFHLPFCPNCLKNFVYIHPLHFLPTTLLHNEKLLVLFAKYNYNDQVKDEIGRACSTIGEKMNACRLLVGKPEGKIHLRRPRSRWVDNIKIDLLSCLVLLV